MLKVRPALQYNKGRSKPWFGAGLVNCFAERSAGDQDDQFAIMATPGLVEWANIGTGPIRGAHEMAGVLYVVSGTSLYSVASDGTPTLLGLIGGTAPVRMADNGRELCIAARPVGYVYSDSTLSRLEGFGVDWPVSDVAFLDQYIIWTIDGTARFFISGLGNATAYDASDIATAEGAPDNIIGMIVDHRELQFFGTSTVEIFYDSGASAFPFERQGNAFIERGCFDRDSIVKIDNSVNFMGDDRIIYRLNGYQPVRISTHAIEYQLRNATYARGFTYDQEGHKFYCLTTDVGTFLFDQATELWHKRQSVGVSTWRVNGAVRCYGKMLLTSWFDGKIFIPSLDVHDEDGDRIEVEVYLPSIEGARNRNIMHAFEVMCETGVGNDDVEDPQIMLRYSDDGGRRWSNEMWRSLGLSGDYRRRAIWRKLGQFRQRDMHLRMTDPARAFVLSYYAEISSGV